MAIIHTSTATTQSTRFSLALRLTKFRKAKNLFCCDSDCAYTASTRTVQQTFSVTASTRLSAALKANSLASVSLPDRLQMIENRSWPVVSRMTHCLAEESSSTLNTLIFFLNSITHIPRSTRHPVIRVHLSPNTESGS